MSNKKDDWAERKVHEIMKELLNPEPHPFQEEWSNAHSMTSDTLMERLKQALIQAKAEGMKEAKKTNRERWMYKQGMIEMREKCLKHLPSKYRESQGIDAEMASHNECIDECRKAIRSIAVESKGEE